MKAQFHDQFTALSDFAVSYWPFLLAMSLMILLLLLALVSVMRSRRELRTWLLDARLQQAEQGTGLQQLLSESSEIASTRANLLQQGLERRLGELNALLLRMSDD